MIVAPSLLILRMTVDALTVKVTSWLIKAFIAWLPLITLAVKAVPLVSTDTMAWTMNGCDLTLGAVGLATTVAAAAKAISATAAASTAILTAGRHCLPGVELRSLIMSVLLVDSTGEPAISGSSS